MFSRYSAKPNVTTFYPAMFKREYHYGFTEQKSKDRNPKNRDYIDLIIALCIRVEMFLIDQI